MAKKGYSQTIRMKDSEGVQLTVLLAESKAGMLNIDMWMGALVEPRAVAHSLLLAIVALLPAGTAKDAAECSAHLLMEELENKGHSTFPEGQAIPADDLPF